MTRIAFVLDIHLMETPPRSRKDDYLTNTLWELEQVYKENEVVILLGDVLHRPTMTTRAETIVIRFLQARVKEGKQTYTIIGNHDVFNMTLQSLWDSKLRVFEDVGLLPIVNDTLTIEGLTVDVIPFARTPEVPKAKKPNSILLGHYFFESKTDPKYSVTAEMLKDKGYRFVILGHDHEPYKPYEIKNSDGSTTKVLRPGALARHTSHKYNLERELAYVQLSVDESGIRGAKIKNTPMVPAKDVFREEEFHKLTENKASQLNFIHNITEMLNAFNKISNKEGKVTLAKALAQVEAPDNIVSYLRGKHEQLGISFV